MSGWSETDIPSQDGRVVVVTGANSGIGLRAAKVLAEKGATVILACRSVAKGEEAARTIQADVEVRTLDLADLGSVRTFAQAWDGPLDLLVNNAGVMMTPLERTAQGFELQLGTNHLGHFALTGLLLGHLLQAGDPRVVTLASNAHKAGKMRWEDLNAERGYNAFKAYGQSKLANLLFAFELQRRADAAGATLTSVAAHPGYSATDLTRHTGPKLTRPVVGVFDRILGQPAWAGAWPTLYAATERLAGAAYVGPSGPGEWRGKPQLVGASKAATDAQAAARLWTRSEELTGVSYDFTAPVAA